MMASTRVAGKPESYFRESDEQLWADRWGICSIGVGFESSDYVRGALDAVQLVALEPRRGPGWADAPFAIRMDASSGGRRVVGTDHTGYGASPEPGIGEVRPFRTDAAGKMRWLDFVEPEERETPLDRFHNHPRHARERDATGPLGVRPARRPRTVRRDETA